MAAVIIVQEPMARTSVTGDATVPRVVSLVAVGIEGVTLAPGVRTGFVDWALVALLHFES